jgi:hypothetical protein
MSAQAQSLNVAGKAGYLEEWELAATVTPQDPEQRNFSGPMTLKHVGVCSVGAVVEKSGELQLERMSASQQVKAKLMVDGMQCAFEGTLSETARGVLQCPGSSGVPLVLWTK